MTELHELDLPVVGIPAADTPEGIRRLIYDLRRDGHWLIRNPLGVCVIEHDAVRDLHKVPGLHPWGARPFLEMQEIAIGPWADVLERSVHNLEGAEHARVRRFVSRAFTSSSVDRLRPAMHDWVAERARAMAARGGGDFMADLAVPYPIAVICRIVGTPVEDWAQFSVWVTDANRILNDNIGSDRAAIEASLTALHAYVIDLIDARRARPDGHDDLLAELVSIEETSDRLSYDELCAMVMQLILSGSDTSRNQLGLVVLRLARNPDHWDKLAADPTLVPNAVEEFLRFDPAVSAVTRIAAEDITYRDVTLPAGTIVMLVTAAANRDPDVVTDPMTFDLTADRGTWSSLTFGGGAHYCLGAALARAEIQEALYALLHHWHHFSLNGEPDMKPIVGIYGPDRLPLHIEPH
jgi:cytochrome P450